MEQLFADPSLIYILSGAAVLLVPVFVFFKSKKTQSKIESSELSPEKIITGEKLSEKDVPIVAQKPEPTPEVTLKSALSKTEESFFGRIKQVFSANNKSEDIIEQIEEILYTSDLGPKTVQKLISAVQDDLSKSDLNQIDKIKSALSIEITKILQPAHSTQTGQAELIDVIQHASSGPTVIMILGVNGAGKTTSIGKMAAALASKNKKVLVAAGDTFRAAAGGQLKTWTDRAQTQATESGMVDIFWPAGVTDPAAVAFDAVAKGKAQNFDYIILDTAGRLHTQSHLMEELKKVKRVMTKAIPEAPHNTWIVLDANSGQNALNQAIEFNKAMEISGVILTKMDGTAKGGVVIGVVDNLGVPIKLVGLGEKISDLKVFDYKEYINSILP